MVLLNTTKDKIRPGPLIITNGIRFFSLFVIIHFYKFDENFLLVKLVLLDKVIFWADASGTIETAMLDGTARSVVFQDPNAAFTGLALDAQFIYIVASNKR